MKTQVLSVLLYLIYEYVINEAIAMNAIFIWPAHLHNKHLLMFWEKALRNGGLIEFRCRCWWSHVHEYDFLPISTEEWDKLPHFLTRVDLVDVGLMLIDLRKSTVEYTYTFVSRKWIGWW